MITMTKPIQRPLKATERPETTVKSNQIKSIYKLKNETKNYGIMLKINRKYTQWKESVSNVVILVNANRS